MITILGLVQNFVKLLVFNDQNLIIAEILIVKGQHFSVGPKFVRILVFLAHNFSFSGQNCSVER